MSACDTCRAPGRCCTGFDLPIHAETTLELLVLLATVHHGAELGRPVFLSRGGGAWTAQEGVGSAAVGLPFLPLYRVSGVRWRFWCPLLGRDGRCTDYAHRPFLCRHYQPGTDALCAEWVPPPQERPASP